MAVRQRRKAIRVKGKVEMMLVRPAKMFDLKMVGADKKTGVKVFIECDQDGED